MMDLSAEKELNLVRGLCSLGSFSEAADLLKRIIISHPTLLEAHHELCKILWQQGIFDEAIISIHKFISLSPDNLSAYILLGHVLRETDKSAEAIEAYQKALEISPLSFEAHHSLALALKEHTSFQTAFECYDRALSIGPNDPEIHNNRSILSLLLGDYRSGFAEYEWRKKKNERYGCRDFIQPEWSGQDLKEKILLIHHEQGMGDAIQFSRYVKVLSDRGLNILYAAHPPLIRLLSSMGNVNFIDMKNPLPRFDYHCPLLSLPLRMNTEVETIPANIPYLFAEPQRIEKWRKRIGDSGFKVGLAWQGSGGRYGKNRLFPLTYLRLLQQLPNVRLIGLHKSPLHSPWTLPDEIHIESLGPDFDADSDAFLDCAAAIECCDLVISCDTAIAHLSGALGKKTWIILRHVPHWVWMMDRSDSPWYPTTKLFRQKELGNWQSAFEEVIFELSTLISSKNKSEQIL